MSVKRPAVVFELGLAPSRNRQRKDTVSVRKQHSSAATARRNFKNAERRVVSKQKGN